MDTPLPPVFSILPDPDEPDEGAQVTLAPKLAKYAGILDYDSRGNANITIIQQDTQEVVFDFCLDNGDINADELTQQ